MRLDRENGRFLGVCAGVANWLDVPAVLVRIVFVICTLAWPPLIIGYFVIYFCVDKDFTPDQIRDYFSDTETAAHFRRVDYRKPIYRNTDNKRVAGVCAGIADYLEVSAFSVRIVTLLSFFLFGPFTFWAYLIGWFVLEPDPECASSGDSYLHKRREKRAARHRRRAERMQAKMSGCYGRSRIYKGFARKGYRNSEESPAESAEDFHYQEEASEQSAKNASREAKSSNRYSRMECTRLYSELEQRLRGIEAFMTSKRFRLHCEINRI
jgi:phage shock protein PspC (stress-responsive transcriptional regulator)